MLSDNKVSSRNTLLSISVSTLVAQFIVLLSVGVSCSLLSREYRPFIPPLIRLYFSSIIITFNAVLAIGQKKAKQKLNTDIYNHWISNPRQRGLEADALLHHSSRHFCVSIQSTHTGFPLQSLEKRPFSPHLRYRLNQSWKLVQAFVMCQTRTAIYILDSVHVVNRPPNKHINAICVSLYVLHSPNTLADGGPN